MEDIGGIMAVHSQSPREKFPHSYVAEEHYGKYGVEIKYQRGLRDIDIFEVNVNVLIGEDKDFINNFEELVDKLVRRYSKSYEYIFKIKQYGNDAWSTIVLDKNKDFELVKIIQYVLHNELSLGLSDEQQGVNMKKLKYKASIFIGRFQPVHKAHLDIIEKALEISEIVVISVGSANKPRSMKNPFTSDERVQMMRNAIRDRFRKASGWSDYPEEYETRIRFIQARDHMYNNTRWASELYSKAVKAGATQDKDTCLIGCFKDDSSWYLKMFPQWDFYEINRIYYGKQLISSTDIREELFERSTVDVSLPIITEQTHEDLIKWTESKNYTNIKDEYDFVKKYKKQWSNSPYAPIFVTTDNVVIKSGHILLIKRKFNPGKGLWALPGGFVDQNETIKDSAIRELKEETRIKVDKPVLRRNIIESKIFDHPNRSERGRTITHAFLIDLGEGPLPVVKGGDDASGAHWWPLADLQSIEREMYEDHNDIIVRLTSKFQDNRELSK